MATMQRSSDVETLGRPPGARRTLPDAWERLAPLTGIAAILLGLAGLIVLEGPADRPPRAAATWRLLAYFQDHQDTVVLGGFLFMLGAVCFLWFAGSLRTVLRGAEGGAGRLSAIAYGGGVATAGLVLMYQGPPVLGAFYEARLTPTTAQAFFYLGDAFWYPAAMAAAVLVGATALVSLRIGGLPRWLGWLSVPLALWLLVPPFGGPVGGAELNPPAFSGPAALLAVFPLWVIVVAVVLVRRSRHP